MTYFWQNWNIPVHKWCLRYSLAVGPVIGGGGVGACSGTGYWQGLVDLSVQIHSQGVERRIPSEPKESVFIYI